MTDHAPQLRHNRPALLLLILLLCTAFLGNFWAPRLFLGFNYLFGSIFVLLVVRLYGTWWGLLAGIIASSWTLVLFGHPYAMLWLCAEPVVVGWLLSRKRSSNLLLYDAIYWPLVGAPLLWLVFRHVLQLPVLGTATALLMYWTIGLANALMVNLLLNGFPRLVLVTRPHSSPSIPLRHLMFNLMMGMVLIPAIIIMIIHGRYTEKRYLHDLYDGLEDSSRIARYELRLRAHKPAEGAETLEELLRSARVKPFHVLTVIDATDRILASSDNGLAVGERFQACREGVLHSITGSQVQHCLPQPASPMPLWQRVQQSTYLLSIAVDGESAWRVIAATPFAPYQVLLFQAQRNALVVVLSLYMLTLLFALIISRRLLTPLRRLSQVTTDFPERLLRNEVSVWPGSLIAEIEQLGENFRIMAYSLGEKFHEISRARETLELRVEERTSELTRINQDLQHEISERKLTELQRDHLMDELVNQVQFLQTLIDAIPNPLFYKDIQGRYQGCNRAFEEGWGLTREQIMGKGVHELFPAAAADIFYKADQELFATGGVQVYETRLTYADGTPHVGIFYKATFNDSHGRMAGLIGTLIDITDRKRAETERDKLMLELRQKNKELEGIIYIASHDLRSPLVNAQGFSRKLQKSCTELQQLTAGLEMPREERQHLDLLLQEQIPRYLGFITGSVEKMDGLLNGLLRLSRLGRAALTFEVLDMHEILEKIVASLAFQIEVAGARIELGQLDSCLADPVQVSQVFSNLLDNSLKYRSTERPLVVRLYSETVEDGIRYWVEDNGIGIHPDNHDAIWDIFCRVNSDQISGEGLGLTICRRIVDRLGGSMGVESVPGQGSRFFVVLPCGRNG